MFRFIHMADVHLDSPMHQRAGHRECLREALEQAFRSAIDLAIEKQCHALLIAGDLFDGDDLSFNTEKMLYDSFIRLHSEGIKVFYCYGNHDPANARRRQINWPENVIVFSGKEPQTHTLTEKNGQVIAHVVGAGFPVKDVRENLSLNYPIKQFAEPIVGLLHAMVGQYSTEHEPYAACTTADLESKGYDYWALGHIHQRMVLGGSGTIIYAGNLSGRNIKEQGDKGVYLVELEAGMLPKKEFVPLSKVMWHHLCINEMENINDPVDLYESIVNKLNQLSNDKKHYVRLTLEGGYPLSETLDDAIEEMERQLYTDTGIVVELKNRTTLPLDLAEYTGKKHLLSAVLQLLEDARGDEDLLKRLCDNAKLDGEDAPDYRRELLEEMDKLLIDAMLTEEHKHAYR